MAITPSPLRYPGGKTSIWKTVAELISYNKIININYAEPFAGGAGLALSLLFNGYVKELYLNDLDKSIWSFWYCILNDTNNFIKKIEDTPITIEEWHKQKEIQKSPEKYSTLDLGFSTFFLNRTNRSGVIIKAGVIGGLKQEGAYKLDCRFNKKKLISKIVKIEHYKNKIHLYNLDALDFFDELESKSIEKLLYCIDPPYYEKGATLYTNFYKHNDHVSLSKKINNLKKPWILTYDNAEEISLLYDKFKQYNFKLNYSAAKKRKGTEQMILSNNLFISKNNLFFQQKN